jgi:hypothetical protein
MWTRDAGRAIRWDGVGTLAPGAYADLVVLDRDPFACTADELGATRALATLLGGRVVYSDGSIVERT